MLILNDIMLPVTCIHATYYIDILQIMGYAPLPLIAVYYVLCCFRSGDAQGPG